MRQRWKRNRRAPDWSERANARGGRAAVAVRLRRFAAKRRRHRYNGRDFLRAFRQWQDLAAIPRVGVPANPGWSRSVALEQRHINILENFLGSDSTNAVGRFDQVVALAAGLLTAESVGEGEAGGELPGFDQEASAIRDPWSCCFHARGPFLLLMSESWWLQVEQLASRPFLYLRSSWPLFFVRGARPNVRAKSDAVNSVFLVQLRIIMATDFRGLSRIKTSFFRSGKARGWLRLGPWGRTRGAGVKCGEPIVHRGCTGNAESGAVLSSQFSVLSLSCWLVENHDSRRRSNSSGATLTAPQWSAPGTSQRTILALCI
ncbi:MAG: hypothetical protein JWQ87_4498 [Candidatus Sulfotelmatobacter sp.]|nr:hypothetical protein [Candidatus Sulfotelmatobacter sp.]